MRVRSALTSAIYKKVSYLLTKWGCPVLAPLFSFYVSILYAYAADTEFGSYLSLATKFKAVFLHLKRPQKYRVSQKKRGLFLKSVLFLYL